MTDNEKAVDILHKLDFFYGQRAGRELWNEKPTDVQDKDIENFSKDVAFLKGFINRQEAEIEEQEAEIERLNYILQCYALEYGTVGDKERLLKVARDEAVTEFVEGLKGELQTGAVVMRISVLNIIDDLVKKSRRAK
jgi:hypothetical protein